MTAAHDSIRALLQSGDDQEVLLGLELLADEYEPDLVPDVARLADDDRPEVRLVALARLTGDSPRDRLREEMKWALDARDVRVRRAALDSVSAIDKDAVMAVIVALMDSSTAGAAAGALERLGDLAAPAVTSILGRAGVPAPAYAARIVRCTRFSAELRETVLAPHAAHADRELGLAVLQSLASAEPPSTSLSAALEGVLAADAEHERRILHARAAVAEVGDPTVLRALDDELDLIRRRMACGRLALHAPATPSTPVGGSSTSAVDTLQELVDDPEGHWRSEWLREVALHALSR